MKNLQYILSILLMGSSLILSAQNPDLPGGEVEIIKNFDARLLDAEKLDITPSLPPLDTATKRQDYLVPAKTITVDYLPPKIRPIAMKRVQQEPGYNGYAKLGVGLPASFFADASYNIFAQKQIDVGLNLKHHSASNNKKVENQRFSYSSAGLDGTYYSDKGFAVKGNLGYTVDDEYFYGYNFDNPNPADTAKLADEVRQRFSTFSAGAKIFNGEQTVGDFNYSAGADFYFLTDGDLATGKESGVLLNISGTKWFAEKHPFNVTLITDFTNFKTNSVEKQTLNNFFLQPSFTFHADIFKLKIGANIASHDDEFAFLPDAEFSMNLIGSALAAFIGAKGDLHKNNFKNITDYNPYVVSEFDIRNTKELDFYGGVRGNAAGYTYLAKVGYQRADDLALFLTDDNDISRFNIIYDTVGIFSIGGNVGAEPFKGLEVLGGANFNVYTAANELRAWHLPALEINFMAKYKTLQDKLTVKGELFIENGVPYLDASGLEDELNGLFDISLGVEYQVSKNFGAFFDVYNLAGNKRQRWYRYPTFGINVLGGIVMKF